MAERRGPRSVVIEADGGSRGNPGPAAYGAVLKDAETGEVIAEDCRTLGIASNNVAEYSGLIAGLRLAERYAPDAEIEVRMDSKLVVEQMSGRWKIKHPDMRPLAMEANRLAPFGTTYTWVPREQNKYADRLANEALDGKREGVRVVAEAEVEEVPQVAEVEEVAQRPSRDRSASEVEEVAQSAEVEEVAQRPSRDRSTPDRVEPAEDEPESLIEELESPGSATDRQEGVQRGWAPPGATPTTLVLVRHGVTEHTSAKRFSGGLGGDNPGLSGEGQAQARAAALWLSSIKDRIDAVVCSPVRRTRETAEIIAGELGLPLEEEPGFAEMEFGDWDGLTFVEVAERDQAGLDAWLADLEAAPPGGESFQAVEKRVLAGLERVLSAHEGRTVVVVSHVTPIKTLVADALRAPLESVFRMELSPASLTVVSYYPDAGGVKGSLRLYNALPPGERSLLESGRW